MLSNKEGSIGSEKLTSIFFLITRAFTMIFPSTFKTTSLPRSAPKEDNAALVKAENEVFITNG